MKLFNTLTRQTEEITPVEKGKVRLYTCGLTVYSQPHIGNWVAYIYWDILVRTLKASGFDVTHVQNITDVGHLTSDEDAGEDKMLAGALKEGLTAWEVADKYIKVADDEAYNQLGLLRPTYMPRATEFIPQQIAFVQELEKKGFVYVIEDGVYFDTTKLSDYGKLARLDIKGLQFGARVADTGKKNPTDFAVWKFSPKDQRRDMEWESPWGKGFPGWHLECSVLAREFLGDTRDIHTGGIDHIAVHHTNEIAQTEALTGKPFAKTWVHANHIKVNGTKISKSLGNGFTLEDITDKGFSLDAFKLMVLSKHYQTEGNFTWDILEAAQNRLKRWQAVADLRWQRPQAGNNLDIVNFLQNNLDTPGAVALIDDGFDEYMDQNKAPLQETLVTIKSLLGINLLKDDITDEQKQIIGERQAARQAKNWDLSDTLRKELEKHGLIIIDSANEQIWQRL
jgi:cysteinyl-tRNA synthetase